MTLGSTYTTPLLANTNAMLAGSIAWSKLSCEAMGHIIIVNALGNPVYGSRTLNNLPYGTSNQCFQSTGIASNVGTTLSGDATWSSVVLTIHNNTITND